MATRLSAALIAAIAFTNYLREIFIFVLLQSSYSVGCSSYCVVPAGSIFLLFVSSYKSSEKILCIITLHSFFSLIVPLLYYLPVVS